MSEADFAEAVDDAIGQIGTSFRFGTDTFSAFMRRFDEVDTVNGPTRVRNPLLILIVSSGTLPDGVREGSILTRVSDDRNFKVNETPFDNLAGSVELRLSAT